MSLQRLTRTLAPFVLAIPMTGCSGTEDTDGAMAEIPGGTLVRSGSASVVVAPFALDRTEVTVADFAKCVAEGACAWPMESDCNDEGDGRDDHPVTCVSGSGYCKWLGKRLPTEDEWEFAASGGDGRTYPWGDAAPSNQLCWNGEGSDLGAGNRQSTCPVGSYPGDVSPFGVKDMAGGVREMTSSLQSVPDGEPRGGMLTASVIRGGSWQATDPMDVSVLERNSRNSGSIPSTDGFRCAADR